MAFNYADAPVEGQVPNGPYQIHVKDVKEGTASSGNPSLTLECEIIAPDVVPLGRKKMKTGGRDFRGAFYLTPDAIGNIGAALEKLNLLLPAMKGDVDSEDAWLAMAKMQIFTLKGKKFFWALECRENRVKNSLTEEEIAAGKKNWDATDVIDPVTNKPISKGWLIDANIKSIMPGIPEAVGAY